MQSITRKPPLYLKRQPRGMLGGTQRKELLSTCVPFFNFLIQLIELDLSVLIWFRNKLIKGKIPKYYKHMSKV